VRGHNIDISLGDGEKMGKLVFYRMSENAEKSDGDQEQKTLKTPEDTTYNNQTVTNLRNMEGGTRHAGSYK
jgi:deoxycytidine triphosphate deaminase